MSFSTAAVEGQHHHHTSSGMKKKKCDGGIQKKKCNGSVSMAMVFQVRLDQQGKDPQRSSPNSVGNHSVSTAGLHDTQIPQQAKLDVRAVHEQGLT